jgi:uncharacterized protein (TIGR03086 family)
MAAGDGWDPQYLVAQAAAAFGVQVHAVGAAQWTLATPCADWDVRALVNHVTVEDLWAVELFAGRTIADVGTDLDGDQLGGDPVARWDGAVEAALHAMDRPGAMRDLVPLSFGEVPGSEYAMQLFADHLIHAWDLATALGRDPGLDPVLVHACSEWFAANEEGYRSGAVIGPRPTVAPDADKLTVLLAAFGRSA